MRVISKGAKFIGSSLGGATVSIRNADTGALLAEGLTRGTTGDTAGIMQEERLHHAPVSTPDAAVFHAELDLDAPVRVEVTAEGPMARAKAANRASLTQWVIPGKHVTGGDGLLLEIPGFVVYVLDPPAQQRVTGVPATVELRVEVAMMCGCPIQPGGLWNADDLEIVAVLARDGESSRRVPLGYAGQSSRFAASLELDAPGLWEITVYAYDPGNGNTGLDRTTVVVEGEAP